jgi:hypothetical protein
MSEHVGQLAYDYLVRAAALGVGTGAALALLKRVADRVDMRRGVGGRVHGARVAVAQALQRTGRAMRPRYLLPQSPAQSPAQSPQQRGWLRRSVDRVRGAASRAARHVRQRSARHVLHLADRIRPRDETDEYAARWRGAFGPRER